MEKQNKEKFLYKDQKIQTKQKNLKLEIHLNNNMIMQYLEKRELDNQLAFIKKIVRQAVRIKNYELSEYIKFSSNKKESSFYLREAMGHLVPTKEKEIATKNKKLSKKHKILLEKISAFAYLTFVPAICAVLSYIISN